MSNEEVMECVIPYFHDDDAEEACERIVKESTSKWKEVKISNNVRGKKWLTTSQSWSYFYETKRKMCHKILPW
jgi:hypothetical protein